MGSSLQGSSTISQGGSHIFDFSWNILSTLNHSYVAKGNKNSLKFVSK